MSRDVRQSLTLLPIWYVGFMAFLWLCGPGPRAPIGSFLLTVVAVPFAVLVAYPWILIFFGFALLVRFSDYLCDTCSAARRERRGALMAKLDAIERAAARR